MTYTYPRLLQNRACRWLWRICFCRHGFHLWDEVLSSACGHYMVCDACDEVVDISRSVGTTDASVITLHNGSKITFAKCSGPVITGEPQCHRPTGSMSRPSPS